jgi:hypothetical protein
MIAILPNADSSRPLPDVCLLFKFVNHIYRREGLTFDYKMTDSEQKDGATRSRSNEDVQDQMKERNMDGFPNQRQEPVTIKERSSIDN